MQNLDKTEKLNDLFAIYGKLLTTKQQEYFNQYYLLDLSLQEIADKFNVSRNAVYDNLKSAEEHLFRFEETLNVLYNSRKRLMYLDKFYETNDKKYIDLIRKMDE